MEKVKIGAKASVSDKTPKFILGFITSFTKLSRLIGTVSRLCNLLSRWIGISTSLQQDKSWSLFRQASGLWIIIPLVGTQYIVPLLLPSNAPAQECIRTLKGHTDNVSSVAFSADGKYIASGSDETIKLWSA